MEGFALLVTVAFLPTLLQGASIWNMTTSVSNITTTKNQLWWMAEGDNDKDTINDIFFELEQYAIECCVHRDVDRNKCMTIQLSYWVWLEETESVNINTINAKFNPLNMEKKKRRIRRAKKSVFQTMRK